MEKNKIEKSHIYISKGILRKFENENHHIFYITGDYKKIFYAYPKSFNIELGHFTSENEDILNKLSEDKFIRLVSNISKLIKEKKSIILTNEERTIILRYLTYQIIRNDYIYEYLNKKFDSSIFIKLLKNIFVNEESKYNIVWNAVKDCNIQLMINTNKNGFLLPITSTITLNSTSKNDYVLILFASPNIAFNFFSNELFQDPIMEPISIAEEAVKDINLKILYIMQKQKDNKIIGYKYDLEIAIESFNAKKDTIL